MFAEEWIAVDPEFWRENRMASRHRAPYGRSRGMEDQRR
jgi:hypothetical protein